MKSIFFFSLTVLSLVLISCGGTQPTSQSSSDTQDMNTEQMAERRTSSNTQDLNPEQIAEQQTAQMSEQLNLTSKQKIDVKAINLKYAEKLQIIRQQPRSRSKLTAFKNMTEEKNAEMKRVLTRQQYADYEKILEERKDKMRNRRG